MRLLTAIFLSISIPLNANILWCESEQSRFKHVIYLADDFIGGSSSSSRGTICERFMWFSDNAINTNINGKYDRSYPSMDSWINSVKKKKGRDCHRGTKEPSYYAWLPYGSSDNSRILYRKSLEFSAKLGRGFDFVSMSCRVSNENEIVLRWEELEKKQIDTNKRIAAKLESENQI